MDDSLLWSRLMRRSSSVLAVRLLAKKLTRSHFSGLRGPDDTQSSRPALADFGWDRSTHLHSGLLRLGRSRRESSLEEDLSPPPP